MSKISDKARHRRFSVKKDIDLYIFFNSPLGTQYKIKVNDCSISGAQGSIEDRDEDIDFEMGDILNNSIIKFNSEEFQCGRLVVRRVGKATSNKMNIAVSSIDIRLPLDGFLSPAIERNFSDGTNALDMQLDEQKFSLADFLHASYDSNDILDRCSKFNLYFKEFEKSKKFSYFYPRDSLNSSRVKIKFNDARPSTELLMFGSNDYLGLASNPEVIEAANIANNKFGIGTGGSAQTAGNTTLHEELEEVIAKMHGKDDAIIMSSGFGVNHGIIGGLASAGDLVVADQKSHVSIQEGMGSSQASMRFFKHNNIDHLRKVLERERANHKGCLVVTEGAFSMSGNLGKIAEIVAIANEFDFRTMIDQAHCFGILGENYTGAAEHYGVSDKVDIIMGVFSKSAGTMGAYVTGSQELINWYKAYARPYLFSTSLPTGIIAATLKSIELIKRGDLQVKLADNINRFKEGLVSMGLPVDEESSTAIIPVQVGDENLMGEINDILVKNGVYAIPVGYPAVPKSTCRFRFSISAKHSSSDVDIALMVLKNALKEVNFFEKSSNG